MVLTLAFSRAAGAAARAGGTRAGSAVGMLRGGPVVLRPRSSGFAINNTGDGEGVSFLSACLRALKGKGLGSGRCRMRPRGVKGNLPFLLPLPSRLRVLSPRWGAGIPGPSLHQSALTQTLTGHGFVEAEAAKLQRGFGQLAVIPSGCSPCWW